MAWDIKGLAVQDSNESAAWLSNLFDPVSSCTVGSWSPAGFEAYCLIPYPLLAPNGEFYLRTDMERMSDRHHGRLRPLDRAILDEESLGPKYCPALPGQLLTALTNCLAQWTQSPAVTWLAIWEGHGDLGVTPAGSGEPPRIAFHDRDRAYLVYRGDILGAEKLHVRSGYLPDIWWPEDRAWVVTTDVDFGWMLVAGRDGIAEALVETTKVDVYQTERSDPL